MKITIVGPGIIGSGLSVNAAMFGNDVTLYGRRPYDEVKPKLKEIFDIFVENKVYSQEKASEYLEGIKYVTDLGAACKEADFVQECVVERKSVKKEIYRTIQESCGRNQPLIASSTTAMFPSALSEGALYPEKIIVGHPYNPSYLLPLIEVVGPQADPNDIEFAMNVYKGMGKIPILCRKESKGFVVNKVSWAATAAAKEVVEDGVCSVEDMDKAIMYGPGMRMAITGQLLTMSLGVDGGFREYEKKYFNRELTAPYEALAQGIDQMLANRSLEQGKTPEEVVKFRDKMIAIILKAQGLL